MSGNPQQDEQVYNGRVRAIRTYLRKNADLLAEKAAGDSVMTRNGQFQRADSDAAQRILRKVFARHFRKSATPTIVRLTLEEVAAAFPLFRMDPEIGGYAWLAIVSDAVGRFAYSIAQEGTFTNDPHLRGIAAQSIARIHACKHLAQGSVLNTLGSA